MKKRSEATQTLRAGCSKADPQTNKHTDRGDYNTLCSLARSVIKAVEITLNTPSLSDQSFSYRYNKRRNL